MAEMTIGVLNAILRLDSKQFNTMLNTATKKLQHSAEQMERIGRSMTMKVTLPLLALGGASVKAFANFDDAMIKSTAIMTDVTASMKKDMRDLAITISKETTTSATELAEGYFYLASAGMDAEQSMKALGIVNKLAVAGNFNLAKATELAADTMSAMGLDAKDTEQRMKNLTKVSDILVGANVLANATTAEFAEAMQKAGPIMRNYGVSIEGGVAALAAYAKQGKKGSVGGEMFSRMIRLSVKALIDNEDAWNSFGISLVDTNDKMRAFSDIGNDLTEALEGMGVTARAKALDFLGFQARSQQAIFPLLGMGDTVAEFEKRLADMGGTAERVANENMSSFSAQMKILWDNVKAVGIEFGEVLAPKILGIGEVFRDAAKYLSSLNRAAKESLVIWSMFTAAIWPVVWALGKLLKALIALKTFFLTTATGMIGGVVIAVAALSAKLMMLRDDSLTFGEAWRIVWWEQKEGIKEVISGLENLEIVLGRYGKAVRALNPLAMAKGLIKDYKEIKEKRQKLIESAGGNTDLSSRVNTKEAVKEREAMAEATHLAAEEQKEYNRLVDAYVDMVKKDIAVANELAQEEMLLASERDQRLKDFVNNTRQLNEAQQSAKDTADGMLNALKFEYEWLGKISEERERAMQMSVYKLEIEKEIGEEILKTTEGQAFLNEKMAEYEGWLRKIADGQRSFSAFSIQMNRWVMDATNLWENLGNVAVNAMDRMVDTMATALEQGKADWKAFGKAVLQELNRMILKMIIAKIIRDALERRYTPIDYSSAGAATSAGNVASALGNIFNAGKVVAFDKGGIVNQPTVAPMALMGEAGPELIAPVTKMSSGEYGIKSVPSNVTVEPKFRFITIFDKSEMASVIGEEEGEIEVLNVLKRNRII